MAVARRLITTWPTLLPGDTLSEMIEKTARPHPSADGIFSSVIIPQDPWGSQRLTASKTGDVRPSGGLEAGGAPGPFQKTFVF
jgi:hypothetical protein